MVASIINFMGILVYRILSADELAKDPHSIYVVQSDASGTLLPLVFVVAETIVRIEILGQRFYSYYQFYVF